MRRLKGNLIEFKEKYNLEILDWEDL